MMATVPHVTCGLGLRKSQADGFLLTRVYFNALLCTLQHIVLHAMQLSGVDSENCKCPRQRCSTRRRAGFSCAILYVAKVGDTWTDR